MDAKEISKEGDKKKGGDKKEEGDTKKQAEKVEIAPMIRVKLDYISIGEMLKRIGLERWDYIKGFAKV
eukprot:1384548-Amorphochlora_amoeboformis.AAC.1